MRFGGRERSRGYPPVGKHRLRYIEMNIALGSDGRGKHPKDACHPDSPRPGLPSLSVKPRARIFRRQSSQAACHSPSRLEANHRGRRCIPKEIAVGGLPTGKGPYLRGQRLAKADNWLRMARMDGPWREVGSRSAPALCFVCAPFCFWRSVAGSHRGKGPAARTTPPVVP